MRNPNGSDIPLVRRIIQDLIAGKYGSIDHDARVHLAYAFVKSYRAEPFRIAKRQQKAPVSLAQKVQIRALINDENLSNADIAELVGLPKSGSGRVTEVMQGLL